MAETRSGAVSIRTVAAGVVLLALVPVAAFLIGRAAPSVTLALVNVVLIAASVYYLLTPAEESPPVVG